MDQRPEVLVDAKEQIKVWLAQHRRLVLKDLEARPQRCRGSFVYLGYRISPAGINPSKKLRRRFKVKVRLAAAKGEDALNRTLTSYRGLLGF